MTVAGRRKRSKEKLLNVSLRKLRAGVVLFTCAQKPPAARAASLNVSYAAYSAHRGAHNWNGYKKTNKGEKLPRLLRQ